MKIRGLTKKFGGIKAVNNFSISVEEGIIAGLIGPNGAGKTTLFNLITGYLRPDSGRIIFKGNDITNRPTHEIAKKGIVRTFQIMRPLSRMTVLENLMLAETAQVGERILGPFLRPSEVRRQEDSVEQKALGLLELFGLKKQKDEYAGALSGGQRRLLELARSLMASPEMLLLDEPTGGVNPALAREILEYLRYLNEQGLTIFMVEHNVKTIMTLSDVVYVMANGEKIAEGSPEEIRENKEVIDAYLGG